ncbi:hypothetical protein O9992_19990 [Vibrio lentus]|nr:hypothetical protein [Vibrio lentus]
MFVFGLIVQRNLWWHHDASNSYLSSQIKDTKSLSRSHSMKTQLSARLALIIAPMGLGWSLSETQNPLNAYLAIRFAAIRAIDHLNITIDDLARIQRSCKRSSVE